MIVGGFVSFVDDDETEVVDRSEKGGAGTDDDLRGALGEDVFPGEVAGGFGLARVEEGDSVGEVLVENLDELGGEGDFGD